MNNTKRNSLNYLRFATALALLLGGQLPLSASNVSLLSDNEFGYYEFDDNEQTGFTESDDSHGPGVTSLSVSLLPTAAIQAASFSSVTPLFYSENIRAPPALT